jgi:hypothetical protein
MNNLLTFLSPFPWPLRRRVDVPRS